MLLAAVLAWTCIPIIADGYAASAAAACQTPPPGATAHEPSEDGDSDACLLQVRGPARPSSTAAPRVSVNGGLHASRKSGASLRDTLEQLQPGFLALPLLLLVPLGAVLVVSDRAAVELPATLARCMSEFAGTAILALTFGLCGATGHGTWSPVAIGCIITALTHATGSVSGGYLNPAVAFALGLTGELRWSTVLKYWTAQVAAGLAALLFLRALLAPRVLRLEPVAPFHGCHALLAELVYTSLLCFVVLNCAVSKKNNPPTDGNQFAPLAIGAATVAGGYSVGGISGGVLNPALALALDMAGAGYGWGLLYVLAQLAGAAVAALLYALVRPREVMHAEDKPALPPKWVAEFVGTFMLVLTVCLALVRDARDSPAVALSAGGAVLCLAYSLGNVSGAHLNPAVTVAVTARGACSLRDGAAFVLWQMAAGLAAGLLAGLFLRAAPSGDIVPALQYGECAAGLAELVFTMAVAYVALAVTTVRRPEEPEQATMHISHSGLSLGACVAAGYTAVSAVSGGRLNPAVAAGVSVMAKLGTRTAEGQQHWRYFSLFAAFQLTGGLGAALLFRLTCAVRAKQHPEARADGAGLLCEFAGTFWLVSTLGCCSLAGSSAAWAAAAGGCMLLALLAATVPVSGGCLNPAVSLALGLVGQLSRAEVLKFWAAQLLGGLAAGAACVLAPAPQVPQGVGLEDTRLRESVSGTQRGVTELVYTTLVCFAALSCLASRRNNPSRDRNHFFPIAIAFAAIAGGAAANPSSGADLNPAVALGLTGFGDRGGGASAAWSLVWVLLELLGATQAVLLYYAVRPDEWLSSEESIRYVPKLHTKCIYELSGVFVVVLAVCSRSAAIAGPAVWGAASATLVSVIYSGNGVSGCYFNPAVTLAVAASGREKIPFIEGIALVGAQLAGGILAGFASAGLRGGASSLMDDLHTADYGMYAAGAGELIFTFALCYVVLAVATSRPPPSQLTEHNFLLGVSIAACVFAGGAALGGASGWCLLNPALAAGLSAEDFSALRFLLFAGWEFGGALLAATVFRFTHPAEFKAVKFI